MSQSGHFSHVPTPISPGWAEANFLWGATVNSEKWIFQKIPKIYFINRQTIEGYSTPSPPVPPPCLSALLGTYAECLLILPQITL